MIDEERVPGPLLDDARDRLAVVRSKRENAQNEQVERALEQGVAGGAGLFGRHSTRVWRLLGRMSTGEAVRSVRPLVRPNSAVDLHRPGERLHRIGRIPLRARTFRKARESDQVVGVDDAVARALFARQSSAQKGQRKRCPAERKSYGAMLIACLCHAMFL